MFKNPEIIWLNTNRYLLRFNLPIIKYLSNFVNIAHWEYQQNEDEGTSLDVAIKLLDDYLSLINKPVHLVGHSTCGLLGLWYAHKYPEKVKSLSILGVGVNPAFDWVSYYYMMRSNLSCSKEVILARLAKHLFGYQNPYYQKAFVKLLERALLYSLSPHSLYQRFNLPMGTISQPLMICGSKNDQIVCWEEMERWQCHLKPEDYLWQCPTGEHFFHHFQYKLLAEEMIKFWSLLSENQSICSNNYQDKISSFSSI
ncbi:MAG: alpha/beta hydrolase [Cyanobacteria bacterium]|nr:alpha/beta hydrolase [Cyanobacteria bacterium CG_2015-16_32_12]NCO78648.1 alpha/beta hydrolase [Cyanobacteria bacterium CG_2015-22_32_23]NCQ04653.1 alpha/beta hydrolase [Cyanobacteria bacterium CG_2015-09_32_10]NCQ42515.1 alpha/beta hydrolase [Cyanobacteria bacterium CG_2015-04_32_10]NCS85996.1 alpha/beta hydrolase [Cyanobacteria bacterium CG_2015-02_32_10]